MAIVQCRACKSQAVHLRASAFQGYVTGTTYAIYQCDECRSQFAATGDLDPKTYDLVYSIGKVGGYARYLKYAKEIKSSSDPLRFLIRREAAYYPVKVFLEGRRNLRILDLGCGFGYLTHALRSLGHDAIGLDISKEAIAFASEQFGDKYLCGDLHHLQKVIPHKFDLLVAIEVIEHVDDPHGFLSECFNVLNESGALVLTTPSRDYSPHEAIWQTDLPPMHVSWWTEEGVRRISESMRLRPTFVDLSRKKFDRINNLRFFMLTRSARAVTPVVQADGALVLAKERSSVIRQFTSWLLVSNPFSRFLCNCIHGILVRKHPTLGAILERARA